MVFTQVITNGNNQSVKIPNEFHLTDTELIIKKIGSMLVLFPRNNPWEHLQKSLSEFTDDFMSDGRQQPSTQIREQF